MTSSEFTVHDLPLPALVLDKDTKILDANSSAIKLFDVAIQEVKGSPIDRIFSVIEQNELHEIFDQSGKSVEKRSCIAQINGKEQDISVRLTISPLPKRERFLVCGEQISQLLASQPSNEEFQEEMRMNLAAVSDLSDLEEQLPEAPELIENLLTQNFEDLTLFQAVIKSLPNIFYLFDEEGNFILWNDNFERQLGYSKEDLKSLSPMDMVLLQDRDYVRDMIGKVMQDKEDIDIELDVVRKDGHTSLFHLTGEPLSVGDTSYLIGVGTNITKLREQELKIYKSDQQRDVLLAEIHHRVKNNLALLSSLIDLETGLIEEDTPTKRISQNIRSRIHAIARIHEQIYKEAEMESTNMGFILENLHEYLVDRLHLRSLNLKSQTPSDEVELFLTQMIPMGLFYNEYLLLVSEHAAETDEPYELAYQIQKEDDIVSLQVENFADLPDFHQIRNDSSLNFRLLDILAKQLDANQYQVDNDWNVLLNFPIKYPKSTLKT